MDRAEGAPILAQKDYQNLLLIGSAPTVATARSPLMSLHNDYRNESFLIR